MKNKFLPIVLTVFAFGLTACGGGGGDTPKQNTPTEQTVTYSGKVIDGYVQGATVYLDINNNGVLDSSEPSSVSTTLGDYALELPESAQQCVGLVPLVVDVPVGAIDEDLGVVTEAYQMKLFQTSDSTENNHITPLTTVLWNATEFNQEEAKTCDELLNNHTEYTSYIEAKQQAIKNAVETMYFNYGISEDEIYSDYVARGATETQRLSETIVKGLQRSVKESLVLFERDDVTSVSYYNYAYQSDDTWTLSVSYNSTTEGSVKYTAVLDSDFALKKVTSYEQTLGIQRIYWEGDKCTVSEVLEFNDGVDDWSVSRHGDTPANMNNCRDYLVKGIQNMSTSVSGTRGHIVQNDPYVKHTLSFDMPEFDYDFTAESDLISSMMMAVNPDFNQSPDFQFIVDENTVKYIQIEYHDGYTLYIHDGGMCSETVKDNGEYSTDC